MATLADLEGWLIAIAEHTRLTREAVERAGAAGAAPGGGTAPAVAAQRQQEYLFDRLGRRIESALSGFAASGLSQANALNVRGLRGTVEQARYDYAMDALGRQFAAVMKPVIDGMSYAAVQIESRMKRMGGSEQNRLMGGLVGAGLGFRYGGVAGAVLGGIGGAAVMGAGGSDTGALLGAGAGAAVGYRYGGVYGAAAGALGGAYLGAGGPSVYEAERRKGASKVGAGVASAGGTDGAMMTRGIYAVGGDPRERGLADLGRKPADDPRRDVTPFQAQMLDAGGTASQIQEAVTRATVGDGFEEAGPFKPFIDAILTKFDQLIAAAKGEEYRPPVRGAREG